MTAAQGAYEDCVRARVAIDVLPVPVMSPAAFHIASCEAQLHIGHARTVLLGSLIAQELGMPFHIRLDGHWRIDQSLETGVLFSLVSIVSHLGIWVDRVYWQPAEGAPAEAYTKRFGAKGTRLAEIAWAMTDALPGLLGALADDLIYHHPSLYIRGMEFTEGFSGHSPGGGPLGTTARYQARERLFFQTVGAKKREINVPLIYDEGHKVSKSLGPRLTWGMFEDVDGDALRRLLLATAIDVDTPLDSLDAPFSLQVMTQEPYHWSWKIFAEAIGVSSELPPYGLGGQ